MEPFPQAYVFHFLIFKVRVLFCNLVGLELSVDQAGINTTLPQVLGSRVDSTTQQGPELSFCYTVCILCSVVYLLLLGWIDL